MTSISGFKIWLCWELNILKSGDLQTTCRKGYLILLIFALSLHPPLLWVSFSLPTPSLTFYVYFCLYACLSTSSNHFFLLPSYPAAPPSQQQCWWLFHLAASPLHSNSSGNSPNQHLSYSIAMATVTLLSARFPHSYQWQWLSWPPDCLAASSSQQWQQQFSQPSTCPVASNPHTALVWVIILVSHTRSFPPHQWHWWPGFPVPGWGIFQFRGFLTTAGQLGRAPPSTATSQHGASNMMASCRNDGIMLGTLCGDTLIFGQNFMVFRPILP